VIVAIATPVVFEIVL